MRLALSALLLSSLAFAASKPRVQFTTTLGSFTVELEPSAAPRTVENFLGYVKRGHYKGTTFHRVMPTFMIQGGGFSQDLSEKSTEAPIQNEAKQSLEAGVKNTLGSIAMARTREPHSATAQFYVNVKDNGMLDYPGADGWGYCAFGHVVQGMATINKIKDVPTETANGPQGPMQNVPKKPVIILSAKLLPAQRAVLKKKK
jgi:cyclophilin family peptidyl-prolyl cis-trans isomerase